MTAFFVGNRAHEHSHDGAKYEKFVYSTVFGFSVCKVQKLLKDGALDNMLALSEDGDTFHPRYGCTEYEVTDTCVKSAWQPFRGVQVQTEIYPYGEWHVRVHRIHSDRELYAAEGDYALNRDNWTGEVVQPEPNTNLMVPRTLIPTLRAKIPAGDSLLICAVYGTVTGGMQAWENPPMEVLKHGKMDQ